MAGTITIALSLANILAVKLVLVDTQKSKKLSRKRVNHEFTNRNHGVAMHYAGL